MNSMKWTTITYKYYHSKKLTLQYILNKTNPHQSFVLYLIANLDNFII